MSVIRKCCRVLCQSVMMRGRNDFRPRQMYGYGFGLPICLLYAQIFAGSLTLRQMSRIGTDVYLRLGFLHSASERIKI